MKKNRLKVLEESNFTCKYCGGKATEVHHKDGSKSNHEPENLVPVCHKCHMKLHWPKDKKPRWDTESILVAMMQRGIDKGQLAELIGVNRATISSLLKTGRTKNSTMKRIADVLGHPIETFLLPEAAAKLEQLKDKSEVISAIKLAIESKLEIVKDPILHKRFHIWLANDIKRHFGIRSYFDVPKERINEAVEFIKRWAIPGMNNNQSATASQYTDTEETQEHEGT